VDGITIQVSAGVSLLVACDQAGAYVPRLCAYPGLTSCARSGSGGGECGLCFVRLADGSIALACATSPAPGLEVTTDDPELRVLRRARLAAILAEHPHICLSCPDRDGCTRDACTYGNPPEARCCGEFGRCELGKVVAFVDPAVALRRTAATVSRETVIEGRIRREPGLCIGCGRCVAACEKLPEAGRALEMAPAPVGFARSVEVGAAPGLRVAARPKCETLRASGCTFCGQCVLVCPTGALTAPGEEGARWLAGRRERSGVAAPVLPPERSRSAVTPGALALVPQEAGVFRLVDREGQVLRIGGVSDLRRGLTQALEESACAHAAFFQIELDPLFTQRESELLASYAQEHGGLPPGNDLGDDMF
jgi:predicted molibdopterin-dependent oxidoreductase YjgC